MFFLRETLNRYILVLALSCMFPSLYGAEQWKTFYAYNNVTQIAMSSDKVFALSDGSLFSVNKRTEQLQVYNRQSGLHSSGINCILYDSSSKQLIIGYKTGKIDLLSDNAVKYIGELYDKDMTQQKTINNITLSGHTAYLSTAYGIQTLDLRTSRLVDSYWLRPGGIETNVLDVVVRKDSIYAFTSDSMFSASLKSNLVDYTFWRREIRSGRVSPDANKGVYYKDRTDEWYAGNTDGIRRVTATGTINYKPQGPLSNIPYRMTASQGDLWVVQGGRWASQYLNQGIVMRYNGSKWRNISVWEIAAKLPNRPILDFMNVAVDPKDKTHYFVTSYGTGLYEFRADTVFRHFIADGTNALKSAAKDYNSYTRLDCSLFDADGNLWVTIGGEVDNQLACFDKSGQWHAVRVKNEGKLIPFGTPSAMFIDRRNPNYKWYACARSGAFLCLMDDHGEPFNDEGYHALARKEWVDQNGHEFQPAYIYTIIQTQEGRVWMGTEQGIAIIDTVDFFTSDACLRPTTMDNNGENPMTMLRVNAICQTPNGEVWVGTDAMGVYVLNSDASQIHAHYTTENSALPAIGILSLAYDEQRGTMYIGTSEGLVAYNPNGISEGLTEVGESETANLEENEGSMQRWKLHFSYTNPQALAATPEAVYAIADGSLFSVDRADEQILYWNKSKGLSGTSVEHLAYDKASEQLVIAYADGRIDLLDKHGNVTQMPDLVMKAGAVTSSITCLLAGSQLTYAGTPFGILAINARKGEITDTYYIGEEAASREIQQIVELSDSLYAFSYDTLFSASLRDNLVDFTFWKNEQIPFEQVQQAAAWHDRLYILQQDSLYCRLKGQWTLASQEKISWIHSSDEQLIYYVDGKGVFRMTEEGEPQCLTTYYRANDGVFTQGEYWLAQANTGLIRLGSDGDTYFNTEGLNSNFGYYMTSAHGQVYSCIGGRWASQFLRPGRINIYTGTEWKGINEWVIASGAGTVALDISSIAVDPKDAGHFYAATYGTGVFEFRDYKAVKQYSVHNSTLRAVNSTIDPAYFTRTDAAMTDADGNLWVLNSTEVGQPLHVLTPSGQWYGLNMYSGGTNIKLTTPGAMIADRRNKDYKWMIDQRVEPGVIFFYDGGTPTDGYDDYAIKRNTFIDQDGKTITPEYVRCIEQDLNNRIWIGTQQGILLIPDKVDFFSSNECRRIIIPRNDGTRIGDYLLGDEQINCLAVDGGNRMWIGTGNSGLYLIEDDTITVAHFTENNSLLPSNTIQSITIVPTTGEVFVGTDKGIASYRSDASEPQQDMSHAYAYPNPVKPDYTGIISITGLMENTVVNIFDSGGNLICKTRSHGGTAVWDGKDAYGRRATPGVYTALCNAEKKHTVVKILIVR